MLRIILVVLGIIAYIVFAIDLWMNIKTWVARIKIGRWNESEKWFNAVEKIAEKWINRTPIVKKTDQNRYVLIDMMRRNYKSNTIQSWQIGGLYLGLTEANADNVQKYEKLFINENGMWTKEPEEIDQGILAYGILRSTTDIKRVRPAMDRMYQLICKRKAKEDGCVQYREYVPQFRFVDTIGFICPFLALYGKTYDRPEAVDLAIHQIKEYYKKGLHNETLVPAHAISIELNFPLGIYGWGRGVAWFMLGILDMWKELDIGHSEYQNICLMIKDFADKMKLYQNTDGNYFSRFGTLSRIDSSITAVAAYFYKKCGEIFDNTEYKNISHNCCIALMKNTRRSGKIDFSQGDTKGIGIYSEVFDILPFTQGMALRSR